MCPPPGTQVGLLWLSILYEFLSLIEIITVLARHKLDVK